MSSLSATGVSSYSTSEPAPAVLDPQAGYPEYYGNAPLEQPADSVMPQQEASTKFFEEEMTSLDDVERGPDGKFHCTYADCERAPEGFPIKAELKYDNTGSTYNLILLILIN